MPEVFGLALPLVLQTLAETGMQFISCALVGRLGVAELGALGLSWIWMWTLLAPLVGVATGVQVFVARHDGAGEHERCGPWLWQALWLTLPVMLLWAALLALLMPQLFTAIGAGAELHDKAVAYGRQGGGVRLGASARCSVRAPGFCFEQLLPGAG
jgi:MATE family multidrug resistance protein